MNELQIEIDYEATQIIDTASDIGHAAHDANLSVKGTVGW